MLWTQKVNGVDNNQGVHVTTDSSANIYVVGIFSEYDTNTNLHCPTIPKPYDGMLFNTTVHIHDVFIVYDSTLIHDTTYYRFHDTLTFDSTFYVGNDTVHGNNLNQIYIAKYDSSGNFKWAHKAIGLNSNLTANGITTDNFGNLYITGQFFGSGLFDTTHIYSTGNGNFYLAKYTTDSGKFKWVRHGGDNSAGVCFSNSTGKIYITGTYQDTASFGSTLLTNQGSLNNNDIFLAAIDTAGNWAWAKAAGSSSDDEVKGIAIDTSGNIIITGYLTPGSLATFGINNITADSNQLFLAKYSELGVNNWVINAGGAKVDDVDGIAIDAAGNIYLTGDFQDTATFGSHYLYAVGGYDVFISKYSAAGAILGSQGAGGPSNDYGYGIATDGANGVYITGSFQDTCKFGSGSNKLIAGSATDIFVAKTGINVGINITTGKADNTLNVYPNPSTGMVTINYYTSENTNMIIRLTNLNGQIIYNVQKKQTAGVYNQTLDFSNQPKGIYFLEVISDNETMVKKVVIE